MKLLQKLNNLHPKLNPAKQVAKETLSQTLSRLSIELKSIKQGISEL